MARQNGQPTLVASTSNAGLGDDCSSTSTRRIFTFPERATVVQVGIAAEDSAHVPNSSFTFRVKKRTGGDSSSDMVIPVFKSAFAAEGGVGGDPSNQNFDFANQITNGIITNTAAGLTAGKCLRAFCEQSFDKGDQIVFEVVASGGASSTGVFFAMGYYNGSGLVEANDVDSN